jgi:toxin ParE1/3/4
MRAMTFHEEAVPRSTRQQNTMKKECLGLACVALEEAVEKVLANPEAFQLVGDKTRHKLIRRFPYSLLYVIESDRIRVLAVAHQKRWPGLEEPFVKGWYRLPFSLPNPLI